MYYPGLRQFQKALWRPFKLQFSDIEQRLQDQSERIDRELAIASEKAACRERQVACLYRQEGHQHRTLQLKHWEESREWRIQQYALQEGKKCPQVECRNTDVQIVVCLEERRKRLLNNLSDYDYTYTFLRARSLRHEGTGQWIVDTDEFQQWHRETRSSGFWCNGIRKWHKPDTWRCDSNIA